MRRNNLNYFLRLNAYWVVVVLGAESSIVVWDLIYNVNPKWLAGILVLRLSNFSCTDIFEAENLGNFQI